MYPVLSLPVTAIETFKSAGITAIQIHTCVYRHA